MKEIERVATLENKSFKDNAVDADDALEAKVSCDERAFLTNTHRHLFDREGAEEGYSFPAALTLFLSTSPTRSLARARQATDFGTGTLSTPASADGKIEDVTTLKNKVDTEEKVAVDVGDAAEVKVRGVALKRMQIRRKRDVTVPGPSLHAADPPHRYLHSRNRLPSVRLVPLAHARGRA
jgi:hypothetical protein